MLSLNRQNRIERAARELPKDPTPEQVANVAGRHGVSDADRVFVERRVGQIHEPKEDIVGAGRAAQIAKEFTESERIKAGKPKKQKFVTLVTKFGAVRVVKGTTKAQAEREAQLIGRSARGQRLTTAERETLAKGGSVIRGGREVKFEEVVAKRETSFLTQEGFSVGDFRVTRREDKQKTKDISRGKIEGIIETQRLSAERRLTVLKEAEERRRRAALRRKQLEKADVKLIKGIQEGIGLFGIPITVSKKKSEEIKERLRQKEQRELFKKLGFEVTKEKGEVRAVKPEEDLEVVVRRGVVLTAKGRIGTGLELAPEFIGEIPKPPPQEEPEPTTKERISKFFPELLATPAIALEEFLKRTFETPEGKFRLFGKIKGEEEIGAVLLPGVEEQARKVLSPLITIPTITKKGIEFVGSKEGRQQIKDFAGTAFDITRKAFTVPSPEEIIEAEERRKAALVTFGVGALGIAEETIKEAKEEPAKFLGETLLLTGAFKLTKKGFRFVKKVKAAKELKKPVKADVFGKEPTIETKIGLKKTPLTDLIKDTKLKVSLEQQFLKRQADLLRKQLAEKAKKEIGEKVTEELGARLRLISKAVSPIEVSAARRLEIKLAEQELKRILKLKAKIPKQKALLALEKVKERVKGKLKPLADIGKTQALRLRLQQQFLARQADLLRRQVSARVTQPLRAGAERLAPLADIGKTQALRLKLQQQALSRQAGILRKQVLITAKEPARKVLIAGAERLTPLTDLIKTSRLQVSLEKQFLKRQAELFKKQISLVAKEPARKVIGIAKEKIKKVTIGEEQALQRKLIDQELERLLKLKAKVPKQKALLSLERLLKKVTPFEVKRVRVGDPLTTIKARLETGGIAFKGIKTGRVGIQKTFDLKPEVTIKSVDEIARIRAFEKTIGKGRKIPPLPETKLRPRRDLDVDAFFGRNVELAEQAARRKFQLKQLRKLEKPTKESIQLRFKVEKEAVEKFIDRRFRKLKPKEKPFVIEREPPEPFKGKPATIGIVESQAVINRRILRQLQKLEDQTPRLKVKAAPKTPEQLAREKGLLFIPPEDIVKPRNIFDEIRAFKKAETARVIKPKTKLIPAVDLKTDLKTRVGVIQAGVSLVEEVSVIDTIQEQRKKQLAVSISKTSQILEQDLERLSRQARIPIVDVTPIIDVDVTPDVDIKIIPDVELVPALDVPTRRPPPDIITELDITPEEPIEKPSLFPGGLSLEPEIMKEERKPGFDLFIKRKLAKEQGKRVSRGYDRVNTEPLPRNNALNRGARMVDRFTNRSFKIKKTKKKTKLPEESLNTGLLSKFRRAKREPNVFVEKTKHAIDSFEEKLGIPFEAARLRRQRSKPLLNFEGFGSMMNNDRPKKKKSKKRRGFF